MFGIEIPVPDRVMLRADEGCYTKGLHAALISPYAEYTAELVAALRNCAPDITVRVLTGRAWHRTGDWPRELLETIEWLRPALVHVQHAADVFGRDYRLPMFLFALRARGIARVVTLHEIPGSYRSRVFHRKLAMYANAIVVHERDAVLVSHGVPPERVSYIAPAASGAAHAALYRSLAVRAAA